MRTETTTCPLRDLVFGFNRGAILLPQFQRDYVWRPAKIRNLLDSLIWEHETSRGHGTHDSLRRTPAINLSLDELRPVIQRLLRFRFCSRAPTTTSANRRTRLSD